MNGPYDAFKATYPDMFSTVSETLTSPERATLALTDLGPVLGCPSGASEDERDRAARAVEEWVGTRHILVLPWPVDVTDIRR